VSHDEPPFRHYTRPTSEELETLNPHGIGWFNLAIKPREGEFGFKERNEGGEYPLVPIASLPAARNLLPGFIEALTETLEGDAYATINPFYKHAHAYAQHPALANLTDIDGKPIRVAVHRTTNRTLSEQVATLTAVWADLDVYRVGITEGMAWGVIWDAQRAGHIPPPSYIKASGKGLWVFWLLQPNLAWPEDREQHYRIQKRVCSLLQPLGADPNALDAARYSRIAGSVNKSSGRRVDCAMLVDGNGELPRYTLDELAEWFKVSKQRVISAQCRSAKKTINQVKGIRGQRARWALDHERLMIFAERIRKTIRKGNRHSLCLITGAIIQHIKQSESDRQRLIDDTARRLWDCFADRRGWSLVRVQREIIEATKTIRADIRISHQTIADALEITTVEAEQLADLTKRKKSWPPATGQEPLRPTATPKQLRAARRRWLASHRQLTNGLPLRTVAEMIADETGIVASHETIRADLAAVRAELTTVHQQELPI
jgi:hypothetical protein